MRSYLSEAYTCYMKEFEKIKEKGKESSTRTENKIYTYDESKSKKPGTEYSNCIMKSISVRAIKWELDSEAKERSLKKPDPK